MLIAVGLVLAIAFVAWVANKLLPFRVCVICAGVSGTWLLLMAAALAGYLNLESYRNAITLLIGGTVVGIAYQGEKRFKWAKDNVVKFKAPVILVGFLLAYYALDSINWITFGVEVIVLGLVVYIYFIMPVKAVKNTADPSKVKELEEKLKDCC